MGFYAGGGGLPRTEQQPAGLIAPLLCRVVLFDPLTRRRKKESPPDKLEGFLFMPVVGVEPTRGISTRDFEFWGGFSIWCHLVPDFKAKKQQYIE